MFSFSYYNITTLKTCQCKIITCKYFKCKKIILNLKYSNTNHNYMFFVTFPEFMLIIRNIYLILHAIIITIK